jgi:hypothetical protein
MAPNIADDQQAKGIVQKPGGSFADIAGTSRSNVWTISDAAA